MEDIITISLTRTEAKELNYHILKKLDYNCYSESQTAFWEGIHKKIINVLNQEA